MSPRLPAEEDGRLHPRDFKSVELRERKDGGFVLRPALRLRIAGAVAWFPGALLALLGVLSVPKGGPVFLGVAALGLLLLGAGLWARGPSLVYHAGSGLLTCGYPWARKRLARGDVAAVRIAAAGEFELPDSHTVFKAWPLDLLVRSGGFLNVRHDSDLEGTRATAGYLAERLGVPLRREKGVPAA